MKPRLNLATAPVQNSRRFLAAALGAGLPALIIFAALVGNAYSDWRSTGERRAEVARLEADLREYKHRREELFKFFETPENKRALDRAAFLNGLIEQRSFPWTKMFMDLERELPPGVHVISLSPRIQSGGVEVRMVVAAASDRGKLEFLRTIENSAEFRRLVVLSESRPSRQEESADTVQVELVAQYFAPDEPRSPAEKSEVMPAAAPPEKSLAKSESKAPGKQP